MWVPAIADGRVVKINVYPGTMVHPDTVLMELDNPELRQQTLDAEFSVKAAEAGYTDLAVQLKTQLYDKKSAPRWSLRITRKPRCMPTVT